VSRPRIGILGSAQVTGRGTRPARRKGRLIEIAVYLALYSRGVSVEKFVSDLWPASAPENVTRRSIVSHLRKWLGTNPSSGAAFLPNADSGYLLVDRLLDSELFTRLVKRGERRSRAGDARGALDDLLGALALVRGPVFPEAGGFPYSWLALPERMEDRTLPMQIVDVAHNAVDLALAQGDSDGASDAAAIARLVDPNSNIPMNDLIRIAEYRNDRGAAATWAKLTLQLNDLDLPEDLPATTRDVVGRALPTPRRQQPPGPRK
jgi:DNA-binding SARP family transcriptional activator